MSGFGSGQLKVFAGNAHVGLAREISRVLGTSLGEMHVGRFNNGETRVTVEESVRGHDVFIVQPTSNPANETLMELLIIIDAMRRASAQRINAVVPFFGYARQDRKTRPREPITAKLVANLLTTAGADRVVTVDLHAGQIQGFFDVPVDHLTAIPILADYFATKGLSNAVVLSPDHGGVSRAYDLADRLGVSIAIVDKRRPEPGVAKVMGIIGEVAGKDVVIIDDIIDTAGTIVEGIKTIKAEGARRVYVCCTHAVFSGAAVKRLSEAPIEEIVVTNTIPLPAEASRLSNLQVLSMAPLLAEAIIRIHDDLSVSKLFS